jgi:hypothetical protein
MPSTKAMHQGVGFDHPGHCIIPPLNSENCDENSPPPAPTAELSGQRFDTSKMTLAVTR